jgi:hypothetical protein
MMHWRRKLCRDTATKLEGYYSFSDRPALVDTFLAGGPIYWRISGCHQRLILKNSTEFCGMVILILHFGITEITTRRWAEQGSSHRRWFSLNGNCKIQPNGKNAGLFKVADAFQKFDTGSFALFNIFVKELDKLWRWLRLMSKDSKRF